MKLLATDEELLEQRRRKLPCWIKHSWGKWSKPKSGRADSMLTGPVDCLLQERSCAECGKTKCRVVG